MSILTDLRAALEAKHEAIRRCQQDHCEAALSEMAYLELYSALGTYRKLRTDDTIRALLDVAEAAEREVEASEYEWHTPTGLIAALAPLVKEANDE